MPGPGRSYVANHFGGTYTGSLLNHLRGVIGPSGVAEVLSRAGNQQPLEVLIDPGSWSSYDDFHRLLEAAAHVLGGLGELTIAGQNLFDVSDFARNPAAVQALGSPDALYAEAGAAGGMICPILVTKPEMLAAGEWLLRQTFDSPFEPFPEHCAFQLGVLSFTTRIFGLPPAEVVEEECACRGADACVFRVRWQAEAATKHQISLLETRLQTMQALLERFESTVADLVCGPDLGTVLARTFDSATRALQAPIFVLALPDVPEPATRLHFSGVSVEDAEKIAASLAGKCNESDGERLAVAVTSSRCDYGWLVAIRPGGGFLPQESPRLQAYARFIAAALDTAASIADARRQEAETERQRDTAQALLQLSTALAEVTSVEELAAKLLRAVPSVMGCDRALVILPDAVTATSRVVAAHGYSSAVERRLRNMTFPLVNHKSLQVRSRPAAEADDRDLSPCT